MKDAAQEYRYFILLPDALAPYCHLRAGTVCSYCMPLLHAPTACCYLHFFNLSVDVLQILRLNLQRGLVAAKSPSVPHNAQ
eukprot:1001599-Rhodomonas_salina.5